MNSRAKGSVAEREVAALIQTWWRQLEPECVFVRTPLSGGWGGPQLRGKFYAAGDLMTTARKWPFTVEVKRRERWDLDRLLDGKRSPVWGWWAQCRQAAEEEGREPMLWFRRSREPWRMLLRSHFAMRICGSLGCIGLGAASIDFADQILKLEPRSIVKAARKAAA